MRLHTDAHDLARGSPPPLPANMSALARTTASALRAPRLAGALRGAGARTVSYAEIPNAHHAFYTIATLRCQLAAEAVATFLGITYGRHTAAAARGRRRPAARSAG